MARARYADAVGWIAYNDDTNFLNADEDESVIPSVSVCLVADLFGKDTDSVVRDLRKEIARMKKERRC